jgi:AmiR/NasT family two-component response regulator
LAAHAAVVMTASRKQANLSVALETRDVIGQAKGILMERYKIDDREAFNALIAVSQHTHRKLREVAEQLRTTGELPEFTAR